MGRKVDLLKLLGGIPQAQTGLTDVPRIRQPSAARVPHRLLGFLLPCLTKLLGPVLQCIRLPAFREAALFLCLI